MACHNDLQQIDLDALERCKSISLPDSAGSISLPPGVNDVDTQLHPWCIFQWRRCTASM